VTSRRSLGTLAIVLLILVAGVALLYAVRAEEPPTRVFVAPSLTPTPTATAALASSTPIATPPSKTNQAVANVVVCGTLITTPAGSGQGSGPNIYDLLSPTGVSGVSIGAFFWDAGQSALGTYLCARLVPGVPILRFDSLIRSGDPGYVAQPMVATDSCGSVTAYAADGANMLVTLTAGGIATQYNLQFQFVGGTSPTDIGTRLAAGTPQLLLITGAQVAPDSGSPNAISLRRYNVARVSGCTPTSSLSSRPTGFALALGCAYIGQPLVGTDYSQWDFDCGVASNDARGALAYALTEQGWTSCGAVTATASWAMGTARIGIAEGAGGPGGYPKLTQPARPAASGSCP
jgi:hypothetical protein